MNLRRIGLIAAATLSLAVVAMPANAHPGGFRVAVGFGVPYYPRPYEYDLRLYPAPIYVGPPRAYYVVPAPLLIYPPAIVQPRPVLLTPTTVPVKPDAAVTTPPRAELARPRPAPPSEPPPSSGSTIR